ncbi:hypothetical protein T265_04103 [Opisthorchis viverrini]|uniref:Uncharacterized protein n=1 Tax=Opisthorchis viverrini TaxID=6198 RepID=A0A074ZQ99_OPIVI|nr:hypothetical protein T265_04103 [Opisthorchis viverrini]KER29261.1 hypothetical protein T265_04103 [Opisthorchis viverrini]
MRRFSTFSCLETSQTRDSAGFQATECAAPDGLMFQSIRYSRYRDTCATSFASVVPEGSKTDATPTKNTNFCNSTFQESVAKQLNVLHQTASCFSRYDIRDIAIHVYLCNVLLIRLLRIRR